MDRSKNNNNLWCWDCDVCSLEVDDPKPPFYLLYRSNLPGSGLINGGLVCETKSDCLNDAMKLFDRAINHCHAYGVADGAGRVICYQAKFTWSFEYSDCVKAAIKAKGHVLLKDTDDNDSLCAGAPQMDQACMNRRNHPGE
eukprot:TRINITY_DN16585_c0_g1_i1.p1 TRINITY_DN16585_c0_g1~~TRINITY_DN16585_c0_g1_i1.p1  ORF type:complete len:141 (-),score=7.06 TRINITY_DN16585_c0_g1_i1:139-561(-)